MKMSKIFKKYLATTWMLMAIAQAGDKEGNGGGSIVCRDSTGEIKKAFLLDLWEGETLPLRQNGLLPLSIVRDESTSVDDQINRVLNRFLQINKTAFETLVDEIWRIKREIKILSLRIEPIHDSRNFALPEIEGLTCRKEQLASYTRENGLVVSRSIWDKLPKTDRAALIFHEAIYKWERKHLGAKDSDHTRKIVAVAFSNAPLTYELLGRLAPVIHSEDVAKEKWNPYWIISNREAYCITGSQTKEALNEINEIVGYMVLVPESILSYCMNVAKGRTFDYIRSYHMDDHAEWADEVGLFVKKAGPDQVLRNSDRNQSFYERRFRDIFSQACKSAQTNRREAQEMLRLLKANELYWARLGVRELLENVGCIVDRSFGEQ